MGFIEGLRLGFGGEVVLVPYQFGFYKICIGVDYSGACVDNLLIMRWDYNAFACWISVRVYYWLKDGYLIHTVYDEFAEVFVIIGVQVFVSLDSSLVDLTWISSSMRSCILPALLYKTWVQLVNLNFLGTKVIDKLCLFHVLILVFYLSWPIL